MRKKYKLALPSAMLLLLTFFVLNSTPIVNAAGFTLTQSGSTESTITLSWTKSTDVWFYSYTVFISQIGTNGPWTSLWTSDGNSDHNTYAVTGLLPNSQYWFYVQDKGLGVDYQSNTYQASTSSLASLSITSKTTTTASLRWVDYNTPTLLVPFKSYVVEMSTKGGSWATLTTVTDSNQNTYMVTGLSPASYRFRIQNNYGDFSTASNIVSMVINPPLEVHLVQPSTSSINVGQQIQLTAQASGGTGSYNYQWYSNGSPMYGSSSTYTFNPSESGTYNIKCVVTDSSDASLTAATSTTLSLSAIATSPPNNPTQTPNNPNNGDNNNEGTNTTNSGNQGLPITTIAVISVIAIAAIGLVVAIFYKQKSAKK